jgi:hypothetical protein
MGSIPFTAYDFFGYLAQGFVFLLAVDASFVHDPTHFSPGTTESLALIAAAYVVGQLIGQLAGGLLETGLFDKTTVGFPSVNLFVTREPRRPLVALVFAAYWRTFPAETRSRVLDKTDLALGALKSKQTTGYRGQLRLRRQRKDWRPLSDDGETLYDHCYGALKARDIDSGRLANLLNLYAFCRNMSIALALGAIALAIGTGCGSAHTGAISPGWWIGGAAFTAGGLFLRYLKIFRLFHEEIFTTYAGLPEGPQP